jgi:transposase
VTKTATLLGVSRTTISKVMLSYTNHGKTTSAKRNSGRKSTLTERGIVSQNHRSAAAQVTAELNIHLEDHVSTNSTYTIGLQLLNLLITENNAQMHK